LDNLTHTLIGLAAGELAARVVPGDPAGLPAPSRRTTLLALGMVGGNLPDADVLWSMQTFTGGKLDYLLQHRGYTHTLLGCLALAVLLFAGCLLWLRWRRQRTGPRDRWLFAGFAVLAVLLHLGMDALNSYGVHPFWPWNNHWYYGDVLFIVEPLYWIAAAPLFFLLRTVTARVLLALALLMASLAILFVHGFAWRWWAIVLLPIVLAPAARRVKPLHASAASAALMALVTLVFASSAAVASRRVDEAGGDLAGFQTLDRVLTPSPAQPFCWDVLLLQRRDDRYIVRRGQLNIAVSSLCPALLSGAGTAPMTAVPQTPQAASSAVQWTGEFTMSRARLIGLAQTSCATRELMQFVRAPYAAQASAGWVLGDLRFDRESGLGLAELLVTGADTANCGYGAPWVAPRDDLLHD